MSTPNTRHYIMYSSPAGTTAQVALTLSIAIEDATGREPVRIDLGAVARGETVLPEITFPACLWVGSPVYAKHAVPPVTRFLDQLPRAETGFAVPFVTWGGVSSGTALEEMAAQCHVKGYKLLGGAKVLAAHSSLWRETTPLGAGHPNNEDEGLLRILAERVLLKLDHLNADTWLAPELFSYQPLKEREASRNISMDTVKAHKPALELDTELCTQCGICAMSCPAGAISLEPWPTIGAACFCCDMCRRWCPTGALSRADANPGDRLRLMAAQRGEKPGTRILY